MRGLASLAVFGLALGGCAGGSAPRPAGSASLPAPRSTSVVQPKVMDSAGLEDVIGAPAAALTRRFGEPRIDLAEGDARKLQFAGSACVLDIYLYPAVAAPEPTATHVAARLRQGGALMDPAACIRDIERR